MQRFPEVTTTHFNLLTNTAGLFSYGKGHNIT